MTNPSLLQRIEGTAWLAAAVFAFDASGWSWWWFAMLLLVPDLSMLGYLAGNRAGAAAYNAIHLTVGPAALLAYAWIDGNAAALALGAIWLAHTGMDRLSGYGFKLEAGFEHTHLGLIGRARRAAKA